MGLLQKQHNTCGLGDSIACMAPMHDAAVDAQVTAVVAPVALSVYTLGQEHMHTTLLPENPSLPTTSPISSCMVLLWTRR